MFTFLRRLTGADANEAVKRRDEQLAVLEQQGTELDRLMAKMVAARTAATIRTESSRKETDKLKQTISGQYRLKLDSSPLAVK